MEMDGAMRLDTLRWRRHVRAAAPPQVSGRAGRSLVDRSNWARRSKALKVEASNWRASGSTSLAAAGVEPLRQQTQSMQPVGPAAGSVLRDMVPTVSSRLAKETAAKQANSESARLA